jgi:2',3'-cyclic-nucleotide 2'-phosphodiesterase (5'-nucleotidase family)
MKNIYRVSPYDYMVTAVTVTVSSKKYVFCFVLFSLFRIFVPIKRITMKKGLEIYLLLPMLVLASCKSHYEVASIERSRIVVDSRYDRQPDAQAAAFLAPFKHQVDSVMGPVVGRSARYMTAQRPEGTLSNLLADILVWAAKDYQETPDFGVYNMGGVRADLPKGEVTYGDVLDIAPFENKIAFGTLSGAEVLDLFAEMASAGGEGVSSAVRMVISKDGKLLSATLNGDPIDPERDYRLTTIDYLLGGTDKMTTFKKCRNVNAPQEKENNSRFIIMNYFRVKAAEGQEVDSKIEGRITVSDLNDK